MSWGEILEINKENISKVSDSFDQQIEAQIQKSRKNLDNYKKELVWDFVNEAKNEAQLWEAKLYLKTVQNKRWSEIVNDWAAVQAIQILLTQWNNNKGENKLGHLVLDGLFGNATKKMLATFQKEKGRDTLPNSIKSDGNWDWLPWEETIQALLKISEITSDTIDKIPKTTKQSWSTENLVKKNEKWEEEEILYDPDLAKLLHKEIKNLESAKELTYFDGNRYKIVLPYPREDALFLQYGFNSVTLPLWKLLNPNGELLPQNQLGQVIDTYKEQLKFHILASRLVNTLRWKKYTLEDIFPNEKNLKYKAKLTKYFDTFLWDKLMIDQWQWFTFSKGSKIRIRLDNLWMDKDYHTAEGNKDLTFEVQEIHDWKWWIDETRLKDKLRTIIEHIIFPRTS